MFLEQQYVATISIRWPVACHLTVTNSQMKGNLGLGVGQTKFGITQDSNGLGLYMTTHPSCINTFTLGWYPNDTYHLPCLVTRGQKGQAQSLVDFSETLPIWSTPKGSIIHLYWGSRTLHEFSITIFHNHSWYMVLLHLILLVAVISQPKTFDLVPVTSKYMQYTPV